jgi:hypothetical protein
MVPYLNKISLTEQRAHLRDPLSQAREEAPLIQGCYVSKLLARELGLGSCSTQLLNKMFREHESYLE